MLKKSAYQFVLKGKEQEQVLAYIFNKLQKNQLIDIGDLSKNCYMSKSSITRFFKNNGFEGFREFKFILLNELNPEKNENLENLDKTIFTDVLNKTINQNSDESFLKAKDLIISARKIFLVSIGGNSSAAYELESKLIRMGFDVYFTLDPHQMFVAISNAKKNDLIIALSYSGNTLEINKNVLRGKSNRLKVISITRNYQSDLLRYSDLALFIDPHEGVMDILALESRMSMIFIVFKLVIAIYNGDVEKYQKIIFSNAF